jgi:hypothetical protein
MINLKKNQINSAIFTVNEKESIYSGPKYLLSLINCQTNERVDDIILNDISINPTRFSEFLISLNYDDQYITYHQRFNFLATPEITSLNNFSSGYYDYEIHSDNDNDILETGKVLIDADVNSKTVYNESKKAIVYKG